MLTSGRSPLLLTALLLPLLTLCSADLLCGCTEDRNRSLSVELYCERTEEGLLETTCDRTEVAVVPAGYSLIAGYGVYKLYRTSQEWSSAQSFCELEGGRLAIPQDEAHYAAITELISAAPGIVVAYIGVNDIDEDNNYVSVDGSAAPYLPWRENQPDHLVDENGVEEHCVEMSASGVNDVHCTDQVAFVCEIPWTVPDGYTWVEGARRFISVHTEDPQAYESAAVTCQSEGAVLAVLETWDAAQAVLEILPEDIGYSFVGFNDNTVDGTFATASGRLLDNMEFVNWEKDQPNNGDGDGEDCLALAYQGYYNDVSCNEVASFICQITTP